MAIFRKKTRKKIKKPFLLIAVFVVALVGYFVWTSLNAEKEYTVYTSIEEPTLPVIYASTKGGYENRLYGYLQDMGNSASEDCITALPEDRVLKLRIAEYNNMVTEVSYEIRSLDMSHFIERTEVDEMERRDGFLYVDLPIQNLIDKDSQYLLSIRLDTGERNINYYTKIIWTDNDYPEQMLAFADRFVKLTFDYEAASGELVTYLESSQSEKNDDLGYVNINSNFSQLTWAGSDMRLTTDTEVRLKEFDGVMGVVEVRYMTERTDSTGNIERYQVKDSFTMRIGTERIYLLNYERETNQIFEGSKQQFAGKRITLGISSPGMLQCEESENERYIAFKVDRELWSYDEEKKTAVNVFSFRSGNDDGVRANNDRHDIKILSVSDSGDIDFVVYGYMNRGRHEGLNGIAYYQYNRSRDIITEVFFMPVTNTFEHIKSDIDVLCAKNENDMLYLLQNNSIVAIELRSGEMMEVVSGLTDESFSVSKDQTEIAWIDSIDGHSKRLQIMDIATGKTETFISEDGEHIRLCGFMDNDIILGLCRDSDVMTVNGVERSTPMYMLSIRDSNLNELKNYMKDGIYIENVRTDDTRIHLELFAKSGENSYVSSGTDTIVYKEGSQDEGIPGIETSTSETKKKEYYVALSEEIKNTRSLRISVPGRISYENSANIELIGSEQQRISFYAYKNGSLVGKSNDFMKALNMCYDDIGYVIADNKSIVYNRAAKLGTAEIKDPVERMQEALLHYPEFKDDSIYDDGIIMLDGRGMDLNQIQYYVYEGMPVILRTDSEGGYCLISGYDEFNNVKIFYPDTGETRLFGEDEASSYFDSNENDFICTVRQVR